VRGHQLAGMRAAAGLIQVALADALGVSQARASKIGHGEISASVLSVPLSPRSAEACRSGQPRPISRTPPGTAQTALPFALPPARLGRRRIVHAVR
jgi:hypothetical protein